MKSKLNKLYFTLPSEESETYSVFIQVAGFETEEEAEIYLCKNYKVYACDILNERTTVH